ncbi:MAG TPA: fibronectin type III domain-containing protein [Candidatus Nitrosotalea sp.]|nr:fibronectin type III domain-containing protein [Candidatus Nitrosotalea sp.]
MHPGISPITGYQIERNGTVLVNDTLSASTSFNDTTLPSNYDAVYAVAAWNSEGLGHISANVSADSNATTGTAVATQRLTVSTQDSYGNQIQGFYTELYAENGTQLAAAYTPYNFAVDRGLNYTVHLEDYGNYMFDHWQDTGSNNASRTVLETANETIAGVYKTVPNPPSGLGSTAISYSRVDLNWQAPKVDGGSPITGYKIARSSDGGSTWTTIVRNSGTASTTYSDKGLSPDTTYLYHVFAINSVGGSTRSNTASAKTLPASYITVTASNLLGEKITGLWVEIDNPNTGSMVKGGYTTNTFVVNSGKTIVVYASNYQNYAFTHWEDGTTDPYRTLNPDGNMTITAFYRVS